MRSSIKNLLSVFLAAVMLLSSVSVCFAVEENKPYTVVTIGDSADIGFGLSYWYSPLPDDPSITPIRGMGFNVIVPGSMPDLIQNYLKTIYPEVKTYQYGTPGIRVYDARFFLDEKYPKDDFFVNWVDGYIGKYLLLYTEKSGEELTNDECNAYIRSLYRSGVSDADMVVLDLGANDINSWFLRIFTKLQDGNAEQYFDNLIYGNCADAFRRSFTDKLHAVCRGSKCELLPEQLELLVEAATLTYLDATVGLDQLVACVRDINPDASIILAGVPNIMKDIKMRMPGDIVLPLGDIMQVEVDMINSYRRSLSPYRSEYYFADISDYDITIILDEILQPIGDYTVDAASVMPRMLRTMGVDLEAAPLEDMINRVRNIIIDADMTIDYSEVEPDLTQLHVNDAAKMYIETGCELSEAEMSSVANYVATTVLLSQAVSAHPSAAGYADKFPAFRKAIDASRVKPAGVFNFEDTFKELMDFGTDLKLKKIEIKTDVRKAVYSSLKNAITRFMMPLIR